MPFLVWRVFGVFAALSMFDRDGSAVGDEVAWLRSGCMTNTSQHVGGVAGAALAHADSVARLFGVCFATASRQNAHLEVAEDVMA